MAKAFVCHFEAPGSSGYEKVIAKDKEEALSILQNKIRGLDVEKTTIREESLDKVYIRDLTAGDIARLVKDL